MGTSHCLHVWFTKIGNTNMPGPLSGLFTSPPNEHAGDSLDADGCMFAPHTWSLFIHHCKQEVKVAETSVFSTHYDHCC